MAVDATLECSKKCSMFFTFLESTLLYTVSRRPWKDLSVLTVSLSPTLSLSSLSPDHFVSFLTLLCHSLSDALPVWRKLANVVWCFPHQGFKERMFFILARVLSQWHSWLPCSALPTYPVAREARSLRVQDYSRDVVCEDNQETDFRHLNARVVQTKPFSLLLLKQTKRKTMVIVSLSEYKYRERIHLV